MELPITLHALDTCINVQWGEGTVHIAYIHIAVRESDIVVSDGADCLPPVLIADGTPVSPGSQQSNLMFQILDILQSYCKI